MSLSWIDRRHLRTANLLGFLACAGMLGAAYYMQYGMGMEPCPLCILQRIAVVAAGLVFLLAFLHGPRGAGRYLYGLLVVLMTGAGAAVASRHVWLQSLPPDQVPACGPGLDYMIGTFPLAETLRMILQGSGECAEVEAVFGVSLPMWTLAAFVLLGLLGLWVNVRPRARAIWL